MLQQTLLAIGEHVKTQKAACPPLDLAEEHEGFLMLEGPEDKTDNVTFWARLFYRFFVENEDDARDDIIYFVRSGHAAYPWPLPSSSTLALYGPMPSHRQDSLIVRRSTDKNLLSVFPPCIQQLANYTPPSPMSPASPAASSSAYINWAHSFWLNISLHYLDYRLVASVVGPAPHYKLIHRIEQRVDASPSGHRMDGEKASKTVITYPHLFFTIEDFDELFEKIVVTPDQSLIVQLEATIQFGVEPEKEGKEAKGEGVAQIDPADSTPAPAPAQPVSSKPPPRPVKVFSGMVGYPALYQSFQAAHSKRSLSSPLSRAFTSLRAISIFKQGAKGKGQDKEADAKSEASPKEFLTLRGPQGRGRAQVAMSVRHSVDSSSASSSSIPSSSSSSSSLSSSSASSSSSSASSSSSSTSSISSGKFHQRIGSVIGGWWQSTKNANDKNQSQQDNAGANDQKSASDPVSSPSPSQSDSQAATPAGPSLHAMLTFVHLTWQDIVELVLQQHVHVTA